ncbi:MAG: alpha-glucan family phosphorylase, partial [Bacteroidales bacterium]|nr:alpha-glucan family phosphorylase [Bacteroidales bacterium]
NLNYYELLIGFDLSVFPSYYEPWGYTPLESLAFHIPTITTSLAGFGLWIRQKYGDIKNGVIIIERDDNGNEKVIKDISTFIEMFTNKTQEEIKHCRKKAYYISRTALWENLIIYYKDAYSFALYKVESRSPLFINKRQKEHIEDIIHMEQTQPDWKKVYIYTEIPKSLAKLEELASNLWWCWNYEAEELFSSIDPKIWDKINNPVALLKQLTLEQLKDLENNKDFINNLDKVYSKFERYMNRKAPKNEINIAYFSMEFGLHTSLKIYSGGLGVLAGDYLKEASDQNKNIVAVGLLYRQGYFEQSISLIGDQISEFISQKFSQLPLKPVRDKNNNWIKISLAFPGRAMFAKAWQIDVGKIKLYLLDTDLEENLPSDRQVTYQLYGGDLENRFKQEVLLGVGGIRLLKEIGFTPDLYHCNEGHAAFTAIERLRSFIQEEHFTFNEAVEIIKSSSLFTTHTPVPAGHDAFPEDLLRAYVPHYAERLNIKWNTFMNLGKFNENDPKEKFSLSVLASKLSQEINAVSRLHCKVTKEMFNPIWKAFYPDELFIDYVTNGVHYQTWTNKKLQKLYKKEFDKEFLSDCSDGRHWKKIYQVADKELWEVRKALKKDLIEFVKLKINNDFTKRNENPKLIFNTIDGLSDKALTIGFARRFATYKRAHLLFHNLEHLDQIVNNKERPVQFIFAGKAHPADKAGQDYIKRIIEVSKMEKFQGKIVFLENYDITIARKMIEGVDLWLNTPTRLKEASGTSGMKALMNGVVNFSVMDGWWSEGYNPGAGWQIKEEGTYENDEFQNELDAELIYNLLEDEIVPAYYEREDDIPYKWLSVVKKSIAEVAPVFTTTRMINEYYEKFYNKLYLRINEIKENNYKNVKTIANWKKKILRSWDSIEVVSLTMPDSTNKPLKLGEYFVAELVLKLNELSPDDISVEIIFGQKEKEKVEKILFIEEMSITEITQKNVKFVCKTEAVHSGVFDYAFRVIPKNSLMAHKQDFNLVKWI